MTPEQAQQLIEEQRRNTDAVIALVEELRQARKRGAKRGKAVNRNVRAGIEHEPTELDRAKARRIINSRRKVG